MKGYMLLEDNGDDTITITTNLGSTEDEEQVSTFVMPYSFETLVSSGLVPDEVSQAAMEEMVYIPDSPDLAE